jgi:hypothetical protein
MSAGLTGALNHDLCGWLADAAMDENMPLAARTLATIAGLAINGELNPELTAEV